MSQETYFISTNLEMNFQKNKKNKLLAGNWCIDNFKNSKNHKRTKILKNFWDNKIEKNKDYKYLKKLSLDYSKKLSNYLNQLHKSNYSNKFWEFLLLSWLTIYLPSYYFRWKLLKKSLNTKKKINFNDLKFVENNFMVIDTYDFHHKISSNEYFNYYVFRKVFIHLSKKNKNLILKKKNFIISKDKLKNFDVKRFKFNIYFKKILNLIFNLIYRKNKIFIEKAVFRIKDNLKINFLLKQIPTCFHDVFEGGFGNKELYKSTKKNLKLRKTVNFQITNKDEFKKFIDANIIEDMPICFIEGFSEILKYTKLIKFKPKVILSSYYHYFNELFKVWCASLVESKISKILIVSHGGGAYLKNPSCLNFEYEISDKKINWYKSKLKNEIQLPATKFLSKKNDNNTDEHINFVEGPIQTFPNRITQATIGHENLSLYNNFISLFKSLNKDIKEKIIFLPKQEYKPKTTFYLERYLTSNQIKKSNMFNYYNGKSRLNILTYPETAFCESLLSTPTILIYEKNMWEFKNQFKSLYRELLKNKIIFHDPKKAAKHLNEISDDINKWWNSKSVKKSVNKFLNEICLTTNNSINIWVKSLKRELN